ncbi:CcdB family protein, partial [Escherichia coli]
MQFTGYTYQTASRHRLVLDVQSTLIHKTRRRVVIPLARRC